MVQRVLAARSLRDAHRGALLAGVLKLPVLVLLVLPGLFALVLYPDLGNPDLVFPRLAFDLLPEGIRGLILIGFIAAVVSSVDSVLNSASALVTMDFYAALRPEASEARLVRVGQVVAATVLGAGALIAPQIEQFSSLWTYLQSALSYLTPPVVAVFLGGLFLRRANRHGAFYTLLGGGALALTLLVWQPPLHFLYVAALLFACSAAALVGISWATAPPPERSVEAALWRAEDVGVGPTTRAAGALLLAAVALIVGTLW
jgi:SSS family solute:Na+ symporter